MAYNFTALEEKVILTLAKRVAGHRGGSAKSAKKTKSSKANGRLGGRPRKSEAAAAAMKKGGEG